MQYIEIFMNLQIWLYLQFGIQLHRGYGNLFHKADYDCEMDISDKIRSEADVQILELKLRKKASVPQILVGFNLQVEIKLP